MGRLIGTTTSCTWDFEIWGAPLGRAGGVAVTARDYIIQRAGGRDIS